MRLVLAVGMIGSMGIAAISAGQGNDSFANRIPLTGATVSAVSDSRLAGSEPGEPSHAGSAPNRSLWWSWTAPSSGVVNISAFGSQRPSALSQLRVAAYTGSSLEQLSEVGSNHGFGGGSFDSSEDRMSETAGSFDLPVLGGTTYHLAIDSGGASSDRIALSINVVPTFVSEARAIGSLDQSFRYELKASNAPKRFRAEGLPEGLTVNEETGVIAGTPTAHGTFHVAVSAENVAGVGAGVLTIFVREKAPAVLPVITSEAAARVRKGEAFSYFVRSVGSGVTYTIADLPPGLTANSATISGQPTAVGTYPVRITASNDAGTCSAILTLVVHDEASIPLVSSSATAYGVIGSSLSHYVSLTPSNSENSRFRWEATNLPPGLIVDPLSGNISGTPTAVGTYAIPITAKKDALTASAVLTFTIEPPTPAAPAELQMTGNPNVLGVVGADFVHRVAANGNPTSFTVTGLPPGLSIDAANGTITGRPLIAGIFTSLIRATNGSGSVEATYQFTIQDAGYEFGAVAEAPVINSPASAYASIGTFFSYTISLVRNSSGTTYAASGLPPGLSLQPGSPRISGTPTASGTFKAEVFAYIPAKQLSTSVVTGRAVVTIIVGPSAPVVSVPPLITSDASVAGTINTSFSYSISSTPGTTNYSASGLPVGLSVNSTSGLISGTPTQLGEYPVAISATNAFGTTNATVLIIINAIQPPEFHCAAGLSGTVGSGISFFASAFGNPTYSATNLPEGLVIESSTGWITGVPTKAGIHQVPIDATNAAGTSRIILTFAIEAAAAPRITSDVFGEGVVGSPFLYSLTSSATPSVYAASGLPPGLTINASTGEISGTPTTAGVFDVPVTVTASTGKCEASITIRILPSTSSPVILSRAISYGTVGTFFGYTITTDVQATSFDAIGLPAGLSVQSSTGTISGTPTVAGEFSVTVSATRSGSTGTANVRLIIAAKNSSIATPVITSAAGARGVAGAPFGYAIVGTNSPTAYSAAGLPAGLTIDPATGVISGIPTVTGTFSVLISATNAAGTGSAELTISVAPLTVEPPVVSSAAGASGIKSQPFSYQVTATNSPTGFQVSNLPAGLSLNETTGEIAGVPTANGVSVATVTVTNNIGTTSAKIRFEISSIPAQRINSSAAAVAIAQFPLSYKVTVSSGNAASYRVAGSNLPEGLILNTVSGEVSGIPVAAGDSSVTLIATNSSGMIVATGVITFVVRAAPVSPPTVVSSAMVTGSVGSDFRHSVRVSDGPSIVHVGALPPGMIFNEDTLTIYGRPTQPGRFDVPITAENTVGVASARLTVEVRDVFDAPVITGAVSVTGTVANAIAPYRITQNTADAYTASGLPPGLSLNAISGVISGTPAQTGVFPVQVSAMGPGGTASATVTFVISSPVGLPRFIGSALLVGRVETPFSTSVPAVGGNLTFSSVGLPPGLTMSSEGKIVGIPFVAGTYPVKVSVSNAAGALASIITIQIQALKVPEVSRWSPAEVKFGVGQELALDPLASSTSGSVRYSAVGLPPGVEIDPVEGYIRGVPTTIGTYSSTVSFTNAVGTVSEVIKFRIVAPPKPNITSDLGVDGFSGTFFNFTISTTDEAIAFSAEGLPPGLTLNPLTGTVTGVPTSAGNYLVTVSATNASGTRTATILFRISSTASQSPLITSAAAIAVPLTPTEQFQSLNLSTSFFYRIIGTNGPTRFGATNLPMGLSVDASTGVISGVLKSVGAFQVPISATNASGTTVAILTIVATGVVQEVVTSANVLAIVGRTTSYTVGVSPRLGGTLMPPNFYRIEYSAEGLPPGLSLNRSSGNIRGTPTLPGTYKVKLTVENAKGSRIGFVTFIVRPQQDGGLPAALRFQTLNASYTGAVGATFSTLLSASGLPDSIAATGLPAGLSLRVSDGTVNGQASKVSEIVGIPTVSGTFLVPVTATNSLGAASATIKLVIANRPSTPVLKSAAGARGVVGRNFTYVPYGENTSSVTYTGSGLPPGLSLDPRSGVLTGIPTAAGTFAVSIAATYAGVAGTATLTLEIAPREEIVETPAISAPIGALGFVGVGFSLPVAAYNEAEGLSTSSLPAGLALTIAEPETESPFRRTGMIKGVPTTPGLYTVTLNAPNKVGSSTVVLTMRILAPQYSRPTLTLQPIDEVVAIGEDAVFHAEAAGAPEVTFQWLKNGAPIVGANGAALVVSGVKQTDDAVYRLRVSNVAGTVESDPAQLAVIVAYDTWVATEFTPEEVASGRGAPTSDFNGDGIVNLLEYGLGRSPRTGSGGTFPYVSSVAGTNRIRINFTRDARKRDLDYTVEASDDLAAWTPIARSVGGAETLNLGGAGAISETGIAVRTVSVDDGSAGLGASRRYLRLRLSRRQ